ncbi:MAG: Radical protein [Thermoproteota archaeon]|nr:Radical protein [Thermoproteota archaeon]
MHVYSRRTLRTDDKTSGRTQQKLCLLPSNKHRSRSFSLEVLWNFENLNKKLTDFHSLIEIYEYYQRVSRLYQFKFFPLKECECCEQAKEERCQGGCIGFAEAECERQKCHVNELADNDLLEMKLILSDKVTLNKYQIPEEMIVAHFKDRSEVEIPPSILLN